MASADVVKRLDDLGAVPGTADEKEARAFLAAETKKWAAVIKASGAKVE
jgi:tripartite-type tricarboxylate transporter receptor subunit TctC